LLSHAVSELSLPQTAVSSPQLAMVSAACDTNATPSSAASFTCSAPTTPDVQVDTIRLMPASTESSSSSSGHRRKLSHDSGACELEDVARCLADSDISSPTHAQQCAETSLTVSDTLTGTVTDDVTTISSFSL